MQVRLLCVSNHLPHLTFYLPRGLYICNYSYHSMIEVVIRYS